MNSISLAPAIPVSIATPEPDLCALKYCQNPVSYGRKFCSRSCSYKSLKYRWRGLHDRIADDYDYSVPRREDEDD